MKTSHIIVFGLLLAGCASVHHAAWLNGEQAGAAAMQLANSKAFTLYHRQPFIDGPAAQRVAGHWFWRVRQGYGQGDIEATVELAMDGSTNSVQLQLFDSRELLLYRQREMP